MLKLNWPNKKILTYLIWIIAITLRVYGATRASHPYDMGTFEAWSRGFWHFGPRDFFGSLWSDYLPLPILTFAPLSLLAESLGASFGLVFKLFHLTLELVLIALIPTISLIPKILLLLSPALIGDTAFWGQVDSIPSLLTLLSLSLLMPSMQSNHKKGVVIPAVLLGLAVAYKPIMVLVAPVLWIVSLKSKISWWKLPLISSLVFFATALPFAPNLLGVPGLMYERVLGQAGTYPHLSINAFNFWTIVPSHNWTSDSSTVLGISGRFVGLSIFLFFLFLTFNRWKKQKFDPKMAYKVAGIILLVFYAFTTRMHERHMLFALPFLALAASYESSLIVASIVLSLLFTANLAIAYIWSYNNQLWIISDWMISLLSQLTTVTTLYVASIWNFPKWISTLKRIVATNKSLLIVLVFASMLRLIGISHPSQYIFDEVYHAFTAREYLNNHVEAWEWWTTPPEGVAYEWTHPGMAKYGMVLSMTFFGENALGWRLPSAILGVLSILGIYCLVYALTSNKSLALLSSFLVSIEGLHLAQSRIAMNDIYFLNFYIWSLYLAVKSRWKYAGILYGLALASKWSALYGVVPLAFIYLHNELLGRFSFKNLLLHFFKIIRLLLISVIVYVLSFAPFILAGHTWDQFVELHRQMWYYHTHLVATHGYQSTPLQWIFNIRPVWYWVNYGEGVLSNIYAISNPLILWLGLVAFILQLKKIFTYPTSLFYILYLVFTLPWIFSPRIMFFYHYLPSATFLCVILSSWLISLPKKVSTFLLVATIISLLIISPMIFGYKMSSIYWNTLFSLIPTWK